MRRVTTFVPALAALAMAPMASAQEIKWRKDYDAGVKEAKTSGKLVMVDFFTEW